jgi:pyrroline-5-carboxylate reductase
MIKLSEHIFDKKILFIGFGKMALAITQGLIKNGIDKKKLYCVDPIISDEAKSLKINSYTSLARIKNRDFDICIIAIKPQNFSEVLTEYKNFNPSTLFVSIAAGKKLSSIKKIIGNNKNIIRVMPNLPAIVGQGVTAILKPKNIQKSNFDLVKQIFDFCGDTIEVFSEKELDIMTAISGSAPGYIFYFMEIMQNIIETYGFDNKTARKIVLSNFTGSAILAKNFDKDFSSLKNSVTSKGGTTEAGLKIFCTKNVFENLFRNAIDAAYKKAVELSD